MSLYSVALRFLFTGSKEPTITVRKDMHKILEDTKDIEVEELERPAQIPDLILTLG